MKEYIIGIDGGGSKTDFLLTDKELNEVKRRFDSRSNPNDIGIENACKLIKKNALALCLDAGIDKSDVKAVFAGIAGASSSDFAERIGNALKEAFPQAKAEALHDGMNVLYGAFPDGDGVSVICGTGSSCFVKKGREIHRIGGYGAFDMCGNGYEIGRAAFAHALRTVDGRDEKTLLSEMMTEKAGGDLLKSLDKIVAMTKKELASCALIVFDAAEKGDKTAVSIIDMNMNYVAGLIKQAGTYFEGDYTVALAGGVLSNGIALKLLREKLSKRVTLVKSENAPSFGAAAYARQLLT